MLQQYLPFTVLKHATLVAISASFIVATVLTVYGIETRYSLVPSAFVWVATVLTVYGIETYVQSHLTPRETMSCNSTYRLRY